MQVTKTALKRIVLNRLYDHLRTHYSVSLSRATFVNAEPEAHAVDAATAFRSDIEIEELQRALDRIDEGAYGTCIHCNAELPLEDIRKDPCKRICRGCEKFVF
ncbi:MAG: hypothetical protein OEV30_04700 [Ignavibacteria bacterium]|nr:hypothetical protein [Ignavibacteria bacterium]